MNKVKKHVSIKELLGAFGGICIILLIATPIINMVNLAYERWTPTTSWYEYQGIIPVKPAFNKGEIIKFSSRIEYKQNLDMVWSDYLVCNVGKENRKLKTQIWPTAGKQSTQKGLVGVPDEEGNVSSWAYTADPTPKNATACFLNATAIGYTPNYGYRKEYNYITPWFPVNQTPGKPLEL